MFLELSLLGLVEWEYLNGSIAFSVIWFLLKIEITSCILKYDHKEVGTVELLNLMLMLQSNENSDSMRVSILI